MRHRRFAVFPFLIFLGVVGVTLTASCDALAPRKGSLAVQSTCQELRRYRLPDDPSSETREIPARIRLLQRRFKHQLRDLIAELLNQDADSTSRRTAEIRTLICAKFKALGLTTRTKKNISLFNFGHVLDVSVSRSPAHPDFLAVGIVIDASWAEDESLYIFQRQSSGWVDVLAAEVNDYRYAWYAQSSAFNYAISPSAADGSWFLVTASVNPYGVSAWQHLTYTALFPGHDADHPKMLLRRTHDIYLEDEPYCHIKTTTDGFRIWFPVGFSPAEERYTDQYRISDGVARRIVVRCRTQDEMGHRVPCDTGNHSYSERLERTYQRIKRQTPQ